MKLLALVAILSLVGVGQAIKCYACMSKNLRDSLTLPEGMLEVLQAANVKSCDNFDTEKPNDSFLQNCPPFHSGCMKMTDPNNPDNVVRSCFVLAQDKCEGPICYCDSDMCNGSSRGWPSVVVLLTGLAAALMGGR